MSAAWPVAGYTYFIAAVDGRGFLVRTLWKMWKTSAESAVARSQSGHVSNFIQTPHPNLRKQDSSNTKAKRPSVST